MNRSMGFKIWYNFLCPQLQAYTFLSNISVDGFENLASGYFFHILHDFTRDTLLIISSAINIIDYLSTIWYNRGRFTWNSNASPEFDFYMLIRNVQDQHHIWNLNYTLQYYYYIRVTLRKIVPTKHCKFLFPLF